MTKELTFSWWAGRDGEHYEINENTREDVIRVGKETFDESFHIVEASQDANYSFPDADRLWEIFTEDNEELGGEDNYFGENVVITPEAEADLTKSFREMFCAWMERNSIAPYVYTFTAQRNAEFIEVGQDPDEARDDRDERRRIEEEN